MTQKPYLPGIWRFIGLALTLVIGIMLIGQPRNPYNWILLVVVGLVIALTFIKRNINPADAYNAKSERSTMYKIFFLWGLRHHYNTRTRGYVGILCPSGFRSAEICVSLRSACNHYSMGLCISGIFHLGRVLL